MNLADLRHDLADRLDGIFVSVAARPGDTIVDYPAAIIEIVTLEPSTFGPDAWDAAVTITALVSRSDQADAWDTLEHLLSDNRLFDALAGYDFQRVENIGTEITVDDGTFLGFVINLVAVA